MLETTITTVRRAHIPTWVRLLIIVYGVRESVSHHRFFSSWIFSSFGLVRHRDALEIRGLDFRETRFENAEP